MNLLHLNYSKLSLIYTSIAYSSLDVVFINICSRLLYIAYAYDEMKKGYFRWFVEVEQLEGEATGNKLGCMYT